MSRSFEYSDHTANGYVSITQWNADHTGCGVCHCQRGDLQKNIEALENGGWIDRTFLKQRFNYQTRKWENNS